MHRESKSIKLEFEILKLVFFIVSYFLITEGIGTGSVPDEVGLSSFYNTLFIFSASAWSDYLSLLNSSEFNKRYYDGRYETNPYIALVGSLVGIFTVSISLYCICKNGPELYGVALCIYYISLIYIGLKSVVITDLIIKKVTYGEI